MIILQHWIRVMLKINIEPNKMETIIKPICFFQRSKLHEIYAKSTVIKVKYTFFNVRRQTLNEKN